MMKIFFALALFCASLAAADAVAPPVSNQPIEVQKTFKLIARKGKDQWTATAFFISPSRLLTAAHTLRGGPKDCWIEMNGREVVCRILKVDFDKDVALIESDEQCGAFYRLVGRVKMIGFPFGKESTESPDGVIDSKRVHARVYFRPGMSGGPLVNEYGDVEGMGVQGELFKDYYNCRLIPASVLAEFIK